MTHLLKPQVSWIYRLVLADTPEIRTKAHRLYLTHPLIAIVFKSMHGTHPVNIKVLIRDLDHHLGFDSEIALIFIKNFDLPKDERQG